MLIPGTPRGREMHFDWGWGRWKPVPRYPPSFVYTWLGFDMLVQGARSKVKSVRKNETLKGLLTDLPDSLGRKSSSPHS